MLDICVLVVLVLQVLLLACFVALVRVVVLVVILAARGVLVRLLVLELRLLALLLQPLELRQPFLLLLLPLSAPAAPRPVLQRIGRARLRRSRWRHDCLLRRLPSLRE